MTTLNTIIEEENTPDTEWEKELRENLKNFGSRCYWYGEETGDYDLRRMEQYEPETLDKIVNLLTSRDTYWKERVRKAVEKIKEDYPVDAQPSTKEHEMRINWANPVAHQALDTLLDNLK